MAAAEKTFSKQDFLTDKRDIAALWNEAERRYTEKTGRKLNEFRRTIDLINHASREMENFHRFRHDKGKVDKMRTLFSSNLQYIEAATTAIIQAVTPAFPPAATIGTALSYVLNAAKAVSADYDLIIAFFEDMSAFLQRLTILEGHIPQYRAYQNCLVEVFASMLDMCAHAESAIKDKRLTKWLLKMVHLDDSLLPARKTMDVALGRLELATSNAILSNSEESREMTKELQKNQDNFREIMLKQNEVMSAGFEHIEASLATMDASWNAKLDIAIAKIVASQAPQSLTTQSSSQTQDHGKESSMTGDIASRLMTMLNYFKSKALDIKEQEMRCSQAHELTIDGTCKWMLEEPAFKLWLDQADVEGTVDVLCISGESGFGKTQMATFLYGHLRRMARTQRNQPGSTSVTCVTLLMPPDHLDENVTATSFLCAILLQAVSQDDSLCERVLKVLVDADDVPEPGDELYSGPAEVLWHLLFAKVFGQDSPFRLQVIVDGAERMSQSQMREWATILRRVCENPNLKISMVVFARPQVLHFLEMPGAAVITMDWSKLRGDGKLIIEQRIHESSRLSRLDQGTKAEIIQRLLVSPDGFSYVEHFIRQLKNFVRTSSIERQIRRKLPPSLHDLFLIMAGDYQKRLSGERCDAIKSVFIWAACAKPAPTIKVLSSVLALQNLWLDIDEELEQSQLKRFLRLRDSEEYSYSNDLLKPMEAFDFIAFADKKGALNVDAANAQLEDDDNAFIVDFWDDRIKSFFVGSPTTAAPVNAVGVNTKLCTTLSEAHRQIFITCSKVLRTASTEMTELIHYASISCWRHHGEVDFSSHTHAEQVEFLEATALLLSDEDCLTSNLITQGTTLFFLAGSVSGSSMNQDGVFIGLTSALACTRNSNRSHIDDLSEVARKWMLSTYDNEDKILQPLAKGMVKKWLNAKDKTQVIYLRDLAYVCCKVAQNPRDTSLATNISSFQGDPHIVAEVAGTAGVLATEPSSLIVTALSIIFEDTWSCVRELRSTSQDRIEMASTLLRKAAEKSERNSEHRYLALIQLLDIQESCREYAPDAEEILDDLSGIPSLTPSMRSHILGHKACIMYSSKQYQEALSACAEARHANNGLVEFDCLSTEIDAKIDSSGCKAAATLMSSWDPATKVQYLVQLNRGNAILKLAAAAADHGRLLNDIYRDIAFSRRGSPVHFAYAEGLYRIVRDLPRARDALRQFIESPEDKELYKIMPATYLFDLEKAFSLIWSVCYEEFREATNPSLKRELYAEVEGLPVSKLLVDCSFRETIDNVPQLLFLARMAKKMGPAIEFQNLANRALDTCYTNLRSITSTFDQEKGLQGLCSVLSLLNGFDDEIALLASAQNSVAWLYPEPHTINIENSALKSSPDCCISRDDYETGARQNDLPNEVLGGAAGSENVAALKPFEATAELRGNWNDHSKQHSAGESKDDSDCPGEPLQCVNCYECWTLHRTWAGLPKGMRHCLICNKLLCPECYDHRQAWDDPNRDGPNISQFCGKNHEYVTVPVNGWRGVRNGKFRVFGREDVSFSDLLNQIEAKWPKAWDDFYLAC